MSRTTTPKSHETQFAASNRNLSDFNFESWARQVRPLLLASLQKRGRK